MQAMDRSREEKRIEYESCFTYEKDQDTDECRGASGRKMRRVCIYCPNYRRWIQRKDKESEETNHENGSQNGN